MPHKRRVASALSVTAKRIAQAVNNGDADIDGRALVLAMFKEKQEISEEMDSKVLQELLPEAILKTNEAGNQVENPREHSKAQRNTAQHRTA